MSQTVKDVMTREVEAARPDMTLKEVAEILRSRDIGSLPVVEASRVAGVITDRDITIRGVAEGRDVSSAKVSEIMSKDVVSVREDAPVAEAEKLMHDRQLRRLPVVNDKDELCGYLALARIARERSPERAGQVLKGVSEPSAPQPLRESGRKRSRKTG